MRYLIAVILSTAAVSVGAVPTAEAQPTCELTSTAYGRVRCLCPMPSAGRSCSCDVDGDSRWEEGWWHTYSVDEGQTVLTHVGPDDERGEVRITNVYNNAGNRLTETIEFSGSVVRFSYTGDASETVESSRVEGEEARVVFEFLAELASRYPTWVSRQDTDAGETLQALRVHCQVHDEYVFERSCPVQGGACLCESAGATINGQPALDLILQLRSLSGSLIPEVSSEMSSFHGLIPQMDCSRNGGQYVCETDSPDARLDLPLRLHGVR